MCELSRARARSRGAARGGGPREVPQEARFFWGSKFITTSGTRHTYTHTHTHTHTHRRLRTEYGFCGPMDEEEEAAEQEEEEGGEFGKEQGEGAGEPRAGGRALAGRKPEREGAGARERRCSPSSLLMQHMKNEW
jgi:hypothetical protein